MIPLLVVHTVAALLAPALVKLLRQRAFLVLVLAPASTFIWGLAQSRDVLAGNYPEVTIRWIDMLGLNLDFRLDVLSWVMTLIVGGVGALILVYCSAYFGNTATAMGRFSGIFVAFAGAMLGVVTADNTLLMYVFWELTSVFSFLLIGHYHDRQPSRRAAMQAFVLTTLGGLAMLVGICMLGVAPGGSFLFSELIPAAASGALGADVPAGYVSVAVVCMLAGALSKSAQIPLHFWLPAAMAAPTPVSGYLHAAAMVKAGVYLVARLAPGFADDIVWKPIILVVGLATMLIGGYRALRQYDLKLVLAYGTVSQLGFIIVLVGYGTSAVALAGLTMLMAHSLFKSTLFLVVGTIDHQYGTRDLRHLSGVAAAMPANTVVALMALASMAGFPPTLGYVGKEAALHGLTINGDPVVFIVIVLGSVLTFAYSLRFGWGAFANKPDVAPVAIIPVEKLLTIPVAILGFGGLVLGFMPRLVESWVHGYAETYPGLPGHLALWGGWGPATFATIAIIALGIVMFVFREKISAFQSRFNVPSAEDTYRKILHGLNMVSGDITAFSQRGSLPYYLKTIFVTVIVAVVLVLIAMDMPPLVRPRLWDTWAQTLIAAVGVAATILILTARRRMKAVLLMSVVGYCTALLFALQGAPDLALTQALVETVTLVVFILVLRQLPTYFSRRPVRSDRVRRMAVGAVFGIVAALVAWFAATARIHPPVTVDYPGEVLNFGYGRNIVNVTLVDTRAWDTIGEISVLLVAATGIASLLFLRERVVQTDIATSYRLSVEGQRVWRRDSHSPTRRAEELLASGDLTPDPNTHRTDARGRVWIPGAATLAPDRRSLVLEIGARYLFHPIMMFSLFLLFSGHNNPGGGFAGGVLAGTALAIRYLAGGRYELLIAARVRPGIILGSGMAVAVIAALLPVAFGGTVLQTTHFLLNLPIFGEVHLATAMFFDIGVYLVVVGLVLDILSSLGSEIDRHSDIEAQLPHNIVETEAEARMAAAVDELDKISQEESS